jgi:protein-S-isoprenylcysteine O-methyltransferase Ste14
LLHVSHVPQRLGRWFVFTSISALVFYVVAGRFDLPMLNAYLGVLAATFLVASFFVDPDLMRERLRRGQTGADPRRLAVIRLLFVAFVLIALFDIGRFHWSDTVPRALQVAALLVAAAGMAWTFWAVVANRYFVPVIRIQPERGHRVVTDGPYAWVRHPGYLGNVIAAPATAIALGSWWALVPALAIAALFVARTSHEDRFLRANLQGYADYAARVRWRLVPGLW